MLRDAPRLTVTETSSCDDLVTCGNRLVRQGQRLKDQGVAAVQVMITPVDFVQKHEMPVTDQQFARSEMALRHTGYHLSSSPSGTLTRLDSCSN